MGNGPALCGDAPDPSSLDARSALVDLGVVGHSGPHVSAVPSEQGADGGVAKRQVTTAGLRGADLAEPSGAACVSPTPSLSVSSDCSLPPFLSPLFFHA